MTACAEVLGRRYRPGPQLPGSWLQGRRQQHTCALERGRKRRHAHGGSPGAELEGWQPRVREIRARVCSSGLSRLLVRVDLLFCSPCVVLFSMRCFVSFDWLQKVMTLADGSPPPCVRASVYVCGMPLLSCHSVCCSDLAVRVDSVGMSKGEAHRLPPIWWGGSLKIAENMKPQPQRSRLTFSRENCRGVRTRYS